MSLATLLFLFGVAHAVEYAEVLPMGTLIDESDQAVQGRVASTQSEWGTDGLIYTRVAMDVEHALGGASGKSVSFLVPGGQMDEVVLTVPGSPRFQVGDDVLVFLVDGRLVGLGQGVFNVQDGLARRTLGQTPRSFPLRQVFGDPAVARGCAQERLMRAFEDGWSIRRNARLRLGADDSRALEVTLLEGVEYSIQMCGDGLSDDLAIHVFDENDQEIIRTESPGSEDELRFMVPETGSYWVTAHNDSLPDGWRTALEISIRYR